MIAGWPAALTVAGSDSWGGAGIQADLRTFSAFGVWGTCAVTAVTAQNQHGVRSAQVLAPEIVVDQIEAVIEALPVGALKTGMLGDAAMVEAVAAVLERHRAELGPLVVDPVRAASQGGQLLEPAALPAMVNRLLPLAALVTPNLAEAGAILGATIEARAEMVDAARDLAALGPPAVLLKGGHLAGADSPDLLWSDGRPHWLEGRRIDVVHGHGTGCTLAAAITAQLAQGVSLEPACLEAKQYVARSLEFLANA